MTDQERLEQVIGKRIIKIKTGQVVDVRGLTKEERIWLIQQAERVEELERKCAAGELAVKEFKNITAEAIGWYEVAYNRNQRYRQALEKAVKIMQDHAIGDVQAEVDMMYFVKEWSGKVDG